MSQATPRHLNCERIAAALFAGVFVVSVASRAIGWDWVFDTGFLVAAGVRVWRPRAGWRLLSTYLCLDAAVQFGVTLRFPGAMLLVYAALVGLYGVALAARLRADEVGPAWRDLFAWPAMTLGALVALGCLYLPMLHVHRADPMWTGPLVLTVGQATTMSAGRTIDLGSDVTLYGFQAPFARAAALLLVGMAVALLGWLFGATGAREMVPLRAALAGVVLWWLVAARGFASLADPWNLLFVVALGWLGVQLFARSGPANGDRRPAAEGERP